MRKKERKTERKKGRKRDREKDRKRERERTEGKKDRQPHRKAERKKNRKPQRKKERKKDRKREREKEGNKDRKPQRKTERKTESRKERKTERERERETLRDIERGEMGERSLGDPRNFQQVRTNSNPKREIRCWHREAHFNARRHLVNNIRSVHMDLRLMDAAEVVLPQVLQLFHLQGGNVAELCRRQYMIVTLSCALHVWQTLSKVQHMASALFQLSVVLYLQTIQDRLPPHVGEGSLTSMVPLDLEVNISCPTRVTYIGRPPPKRKTWLQSPMRLRSSQKSTNRFGRQPRKRKSQEGGNHQHHLLHIWVMVFQCI